MMVLGGLYLYMNRYDHVRLSCLVIRGVTYLRINTLTGYEGLDTSTPSGRALFGMLSVLAEFERDLNRERVLAGMKVAQAEQAAGKERLHKNGRLKKPIGRTKVSTATEDKVRGSSLADPGGYEAAALGQGGACVRELIDVIVREVEAAKQSNRQGAADAAVQAEKDQAKEGAWELFTG